MKFVRESFCNSVRTSFASDLPKSPKQVSECRFDEEALSRMDDERGSKRSCSEPPDAARKAAPGSKRHFIDHPVRTLLNELFVEPIVELWQQLWLDALCREVALATEEVLSSRSDVHNSGQHSQGEH